MKHIDIGRDFAVELGPRYRKDGKYSGQQFREEILEPAIREHDLVVVGLDSIGGYSASFLEEAFGGLVRAMGREAVENKLQVDAVKRAYLKPVIENWMKDAEDNNSKGGSR